MAISRKVSRSLAIFIVGISIVIAFYRNPEQPVNRISKEKAETVFEENMSQYHESISFDVIMDSTGIDHPVFGEDYTILFQENKGNYLNYVIESPTASTPELLSQIKAAGLTQGEERLIVNAIPKQKAQTLQRLRKRFKEHEEARANFKNKLISSQYGLDKYKELVKDEEVKLDSLQRRIDDLDEGTYDIIMVTFMKKMAEKVGTKTRVTKMIIDTIFNIAALSILIIVLFYGGKLLNMFLDWFGVGSKNKGYNYRGYYNGYYSKPDSKKNKGKRKVKRIYKDKVASDSDKKQED